MIKQEDVIAISVNDETNTIRVFNKNYKEKLILDTHSKERLRQLLRFYNLSKFTKFSHKKNRTYINYDYVTKFYNDKIVINIDNATYGFWIFDTKENWVYRLREVSHIHITDDNTSSNLNLIDKL